MAGGQRGVPLFIRWFQGTNRWLKVALIAASFALIVVGLSMYREATSGCPRLGVTAVLAATNDRLATIAALGQCDAPLDNRAMFGSDLLIVVGYWLLGTVVIANGWWRYEATSLMRLLRLVIWLPTMVAFCDLIENVLLLWSLDTTTSPPEYQTDLLAAVVFLFAWTKWSLAVLTLVVGIMSLTIWRSRRADQYSPEHPAFQLSPLDIEDRKLQALDAPPPGGRPRSCTPRRHG